MLTSQDFCLNRCAAGGIRLPKFMKLASELGIHHIELRTDVHVGSPNIFLTPVRDKNDSRTAEEKFIDCVKNIHVFSKILAATGINAMIEPMGFPEASLRKPWVAQRVLEEAEASNFKLVADTFHYYGAEVTKEDFDEKINVNKIGIVHLSSITAHKSPAEADDNDRYYLADTDHDVMHSLDKVRWIKNSSYTGLYSFEPCAKAIDNWSYDKIRESIQDSM